MPNTGGIARLSEQADRLLEHVKKAQSLLTAIILHIEKHAASLSSANSLICRDGGPSPIFSGRSQAVEVQASIDLREIES
ncbi:hypothetical protein ACTHPH_06535 [Paenibacillus pasadenensis]|uniref:hypothetical protein n=1 Tax=Paenibacillus TaxID=44249 RepID=UPI000FD8B238|nr:hypothetical protein [Paenibacillus pasadenensis]